jgi:uncharacterized phage protein gp47/JayE
MPIDYSDYIDLTVFNEAPSDIYLESLEYARLLMPELTIRQGTPEDAILQACAYIGSANLSAINSLPNRLMSGVLNLLGVPRNEGEFPLIEVEFTAATHDGAVIEAGTLLRYDFNLLEPPITVYFETTEELQIAAITNTGNTPLPTGIVEARGTEALVLLPVDNGSLLAIESTNADIYTATIDSTTEQGIEPESDDEYLNRASTYIGSLSSSFGKASQIEAFILSTFPAVSRVKVYDLTDHTGGLDFADAAEPGHITIFVYGRGATLSSAVKYEILTEVADRAIAGLTIGVLDVVLADLDATIDAVYDPAFDPLIVEENIKEAVDVAVNASSYSFTDKLRRNSLIPVISDVPGVLFVSSITLSNNDANSTIVSGEAEFAQKGTLPEIASVNITVNLTVNQ